jgi:hypothetical protein
LADGKLQALTVDQQSIVGGLDVWKHAVVSERVSQLLAVGRDTCNAPAVRATNRTVFGLCVPTRRMIRCERGAAAENGALDD